MSTSAPPAAGSTTLAKDRLGIPAVLYFILSAMAPMTVAAGVVTTMYAVTGLSAIGAAFIAVALVLAVFAVGYVAMARHITNAGALYAYIARGLGRPVGVGAALVAAIAYNLLQVGLYGMFGPTLSGYLADKVGLDLPWWVWSLGAWLLVAALGVLRVDLNGRVLGVLLCAEVLALLVLAVAGLGDPAAGVPLTSLSPGGLFGHPGVGALLVTALLGYVGFEAAAVFSEEARAPRRTVPVAVYTALAVIGAAYALSSWAMSVHYGDDQVAAVAAQQGPGMLFTMASPAVAEIATVLFMTACLRPSASTTPSPGTCSPWAASGSCPGCWAGPSRAPAPPGSPRSPSRPSGWPFSSSTPSPAGTRWCGCSSGSGPPAPSGCCACWP